MHTHRFTKEKRKKSLKTYVKDKTPLLLTKYLKPRDNYCFLGTLP